MKTLYLILFIFISIFISCKGVDETNEHTQEEAIVSNDGANNADFVRVNPKLATAMQMEFESRTYKALKPFLLSKEFNVSRNLFDKMINGFPQGSNTLSFAFVQFNKADFPNKYQALADFDQKLYVVYSYTNNAGSTSNNYYACFDLQNMVVISNADFLKMQSSYQTNIKTKIDSFAKLGVNTNTIKIEKQELVTYQNSLQQSSTNITNFKFILAEVVNPNNYTPPLKTGTTKYEFNKTQGQLTFITNAYDASGNLNTDLSFYDASDLCPVVCP